MTRTSQELLRIKAKLNVKRPDKMFKKQSDFHWIPFIYQSMKVMSAMKNVTSLRYVTKRYYVFESINEKVVLCN